MRIFSARYLKYSSSCSAHFITLITIVWRLWRCIQRIIKFSQTSNINQVDRNDQHDERCTEILSWIQTERSCRSISPDSLSSEFHLNQASSKEAVRSKEKYGDAHGAKKMIHVTARPYLITSRGCEQYRSGSPDERGVLLAQDNRCFSPLPPKETHTHAPPSRPSWAQPVSRLWNSSELAPRATTCQYLPGYHERGFLLLRRDRVARS